jgi:capsular polysaccharide biosynthesis protein
MEMRRYLSIVRGRWVLVLTIVIAALAAGLFVTPRGHTYTAESTLYVGSRSIDTDPTSGQVSGDRVAGLDRLISTFTAMVGTRPVAQDAITKAKVARSPDGVIAESSAQQIAATDLIQISVTDSDPAVSKALADGEAAALVDQIRAFEPRDTKGDTGNVISVYENAALPGAPNRSELRRDLALAGLFGLIVAGIMLALLEHLDITVRSADDAERELDLRVLAVVPALGNELPVSRAVNVEERLPRWGQAAWRRRTSDG